jgi:hypothetical protein
MERRTKQHQQQRRQQEEAAKFVVKGEEDDDGDDDDDGQGLVPINDSYNKRSSITEKKSIYTTVPMIAPALLCVVVTV